MSSPICLNRLIRETSPERHAKAVSGLSDHSLLVTIAYQDESHIRALVKNGDHTEHGVSLTEHGGFCGCRDFSYRGVICYHQCLVALYVLQHPPVVDSKIHLMFSNGALLCSEPQPLKVWRYPWPETIIAHQAQWPEVQLCQACVTTRHAQQPTSRLLKAAA